MSRGKKHGGWYILIDTSLPSTVIAGEITAKFSVQHLFLAS